MATDTSEAVRRACDIKLVIFDVDGVLTDGRLYFDDDGRQYKAFHSQDGLGLRMLMESGVRVGVLTGRRSGVVDHRMRDLGIDLVIQGHRDKLPAFATMVEEAGVTAAATAFVGDDVVDLPPMRAAGLAIATGNAHPLVITHAHFTTTSHGGSGGAREACEFIMRAQGTLDAILGQYLR